MEDIRVRKQGEGGILYIFHNDIRELVIPLQDGLQVLASIVKDNIRADSKINIAHSEDWQSNQQDIKNN
ncbi:hypothetical protein D3C87_1119750 [compost metagenome]